MDSTWRQPAKLPTNPNGINDYPPRRTRREWKFWRPDRDTFELAHARKMKRRTKSAIAKASRKANRNG